MSSLHACISFTQGVPGRIQIAELVERLCFRLLTRHSFAGELLDPHVEMEAKLFIHLVNDLPTAAPGETELSRQLPECAHQASPGAGSRTRETAPA